MSEKKENQGPTPDQMEIADQIFSEFRPGYTLIIRRLRPTWADGFLEKIECFDDTKLDIDYIINHWGGKRLSLRLLDPNGKICGGTDLNLSSHPVRFKGRLMDPNDDYRSVESQSPVPINVQANTTDPIKLFQVMQKQRDADLRQLQSLIQRQSGNSQIPILQAPQQNPLEQLLELGKLYKQLQGMFGGGPPPAVPPEPEMNMMSTVTELIKALKPQQPQSPPQKHQSHVVPDSPNISPVSNPTSTGINHAQLTRLLASLSNEDYLHLILTSLSTMPENKREAIIENFLETTGALEDDLEENDEPEDNSTSRPGRPSPTDEGDD